MLQTTTGSCTRKYAQAQTRNNAGTNPQQRRHKPATTQAQNPQHLRARNVKNAQQRRHKRAKRATSKTRNRKNAQQNPTNA